MKKLILILSLHCAFFASNLTAQWFQQTSGTTTTLTSAHFVDTIKGWIAPDNQYVLRTKDGGNNWVQHSAPPNSNVYDVYFINSQVGWACGNSTSYGNLWYSNDSGKTWYTRNTPITSLLVNVFFINQNIGWACGINGIIKTVNGGNSWFLAHGAGCVDFEFVNEKFGWAVEGLTGNTRIINSTDGGVSWQVQTGNIQGINSIYFVDTLLGFAVGVNKYLKTTDGGTTWNIQTSGINNELSSVHFIDQFAGWAVGLNGTILKTTDSGANWLSQESGTIRDLYSAQFINQNTGWAIGRNGTILKTTNGGVTFIEEEKIDEMPKEFLLSQNYPNPFNPSTKLRYSISSNVKGETENVVLKVYDVLGNEIETLVNEAKSPGTYEVTWNAESLPSGVYFYQLRSGEFVETKKMLLLR